MKSSPRLYMPAPYAEPGYLAARAKSNLVTFGNGAVAGQNSIQLASNSNIHDIVLTGVDQLIAATGIIIDNPAQTVLCTVTMAASVTSSGLSGTLAAIVNVNGVPPPIGEVDQSYAVDAHSCALPIQFTITGLSAGLHSFALFAHATGDGSLTVLAHKATVALQKFFGGV
jgi:hypothetical protein